MPNEMDVNNLSDRDILLEVLGSSRSAAASMGAIQAEIKELQKVKDTVKGNGGGIEDGLEFKVLMLERLEAKCPGKDILQIKESILSEVRIIASSVETQLDAIKSIALLKKGEKIGAKEAVKKAAAEGVQVKKVFKEIMADVIASPVFKKVVEYAIISAVVGILALFGLHLPKDTKHRAPDRGRPAVESTPAAGVHN